MIEKMQFVSITGPKADIDRVVDQYLSRYEIHLENALAQLQTLKTLTPYLQINPYKVPFVLYVMIIPPLFLLYRQGTFKFARYYNKCQT